MKPQRTCPSCGNELSGTMEFCPVCLLRKGLAGGVESGESSVFEDTVNPTTPLVANQHLLSLGIRIPQDMGILGFDNLVGIGGLFLAPLSTISLPHNEIGKAAAMHIIRGRKGSRIHRIPCPSRKYATHF
jgi:Periplasmic binding protein-like domain